MLSIPLYPTHSLLDHWWVLVVRGLLAMTFGVLAIVWPRLTLLALVTLFAVFALLDGFASLIGAVRDRDWGWPLFGGLLSVAVGVLALVWPGATALALVLLIGAWALVRGIFDIAAAIQLRKLIPFEWVLAITGIVSILFGLFLLFRPSVGAMAVVGIIAGFALFLGVLLLISGLRQYVLRRRLHSVRHAPVAWR